MSIVLDTNPIWDHSILISKFLPSGVWWLWSSMAMVEEEGRRGRLLTEVAREELLLLLCPDNRSSNGRVDSSRFDSAGEHSTEGDWRRA